MFGYSEHMLVTLACSVWGQHTRRTNRAGEVVPHLRKEFQPELCTIAFAKMYECIERYDLLAKDSPALGVAQSELFQSCCSWAMQSCRPFLRWNGCT